MVYKNHANTCRDVMGLYPNPFPPTSQLSVSWNTDQDELWISHGAETAGVAACLTPFCLESPS